MLTELHVANIALIDELRLEFGTGLHILSGETGAGKSIVLTALGLILGGRGDQSLIRTGSDDALVEAIFDMTNSGPSLGDALEGVGLPRDDELMVRRVLTRGGRNRIHVNGHPVTASVLRRICDGLVDFSSQHEQQILLDPNRHLAILDAFAGHKPLLDTMAKEAKILRDAQGGLKAIRAAQEGRGEREAFLRFQLEELDRINPISGEDDGLENERRRLAHSEKLHEHASLSEDALYGGNKSVVDVLSMVLEKVEAIAAIDDTATPWVEELKGALISCQDIGRSLGDYTQTLEFEPERLEEIEGRLGELRSLKRKYHVDLQGVIDKRDEMRKELATLENFDGEIALWEGKVRRAFKGATAAAQALSAARQEVAQALKEKVESELATLSMGRARFEVRVEAKGEMSPELPLSPLGNDKVSFYLAANPGEPAHPIHRVASGGELSRILLAIKVALAGAGDVSTFIFDEIDTGIGGATAEVVGQKLRRISRDSQVICITHLPQIAAYGERHYNVIKEVEGARTRTIVEPLGEEERLKELARMLGGLTITSHTLAHAREMIDRGASFAP